ncbi:BamA/TamA family outer membrane protein [Flavicella sp.]|uniref:BamA/TamA family outer membrane protein n=1 Tax=Flavicella sp. TaxID=2957742 RepID=UPI00301A10E0
MRNLYILIAIFIFCFNSSNTLAQSSDKETTTISKKQQKKEDKAAKKSKPPEKGDIYFSPVPVIGANPAFGFIYGVGAATSSYLGDPKSTKLSSALFGLAFTTMSQTIITLKTTIFTENNDYILMGDMRYLNSSQPTWGLGTGPQSAKLADNDFNFDDGTIEGNSEADMLNFKFFRFYETVLKKIGNKGFYAGLGVHIDAFSDMEDQLLDLDSETITPFYAYNKDRGFSQTKSTLVGVSFNGIYDTRDNINNPWEGRYAFVSFKVNPTFIGSDQNSTSLWLEYRDYFDLSKEKNHKNILAVWFTGNLTTSGNLPYMNLPATGWDQYAKTSEPYAQGRFRGENLLFAGVEYRRHIFATKKNPDFFGAVAFLNGTTADNDHGGIKLFNYVEPGYGLGLRFNLNQKSRTNIGLDYGWGNYGTTGFFIRLNENF